MSELCPLCPKRLVRPCPKPCPRALSEALSEDLAVFLKSNLKESKNPCPSLVRPCPKSLVRPCPKPCPKVLSEALSEDLAVTLKSNLKESKSPCGSLRPKSPFGHHLKVLSEPCPSIAKSSFYCGGALYEAFEMSCLCGFALSEAYGMRPINQFCCGHPLVRALYDSHRNADSCGFASYEACP